MSKPIKKPAAKKPKKPAAKKPKKPAKKPKKPAAKKPKKPAKKPKNSTAKKDLLDPEQAQLVLRKDLQNIVEKAAAGKTLTRGERKLLESSALTDSAKRKISIADLARSMGVTPKTIYWLRAHNDAPAGTDADEWEEYMMARSVESDRTGRVTDLFMPEEIQKLRARLLKAQAGKEEATRKLRELELRRTEANLVPEADARKAIKKVLGPLRELLDAMPKAAAAKVNPADPVHGEQGIREHLDQIFKQMGKLTNDKT